MMSNYLLDFVDKLSFFDGPHEMPVPDAIGVECQLDGFTVYRQETDHTCGPAAVRMTLQYMGLNIPEKKLAASCMTHPFGTLHWTLLTGYKKFARKIGFDIEMAENDPDVFERIVDSVKSGRPVIFIYAVLNDFHATEKVLHYGIMIGIDGNNNTVTIANPFGTIDTLSIDEWWKRFSIDKEYAPEGMLPLLKLGILKPRTAMFLIPV